MYLWHTHTHTHTHPTHPVRVLTVIMVTGHRVVWDDVADSNISASYQSQASWNWDKNDDIWQEQTNLLSFDSLRQGYTCMCEWIGSALGQWIPCRFFLHKGIGSDAHTGLLLTALIGANIIMILFNICFQLLSENPRLPNVVHWI